MKNKKLKVTGDCFEAAVKYVLLNRETRVVHAECVGQGPIEGVKFGHAFILDGNDAIDVTNGAHTVVPKDVYYALGQIGKNFEYSYSEVRHMVHKHATYGPWELNTEY